MKIKIFNGFNIKELENEVNEFIKDKIIHDIKTTTIFCQTTFNRDGIPLKAEIINTITVMYSQE